jgi:hypothetical protein
MTRVFLSASAAVAPPGQQVWFNNSTTAATYSFVVPDGVTSVWALVVGPGGPSASQSGTNIKRNATTLLSASTALSGDVGGGNGGASRAYWPGGAGGYSGNGGSDASDGAGGGGGGGYSAVGGGVGLLGQGPNGVGSNTGNGGNGSVQFGNQAYGAGVGSDTWNGGNLRYRELTVAPGEALTIAIAARIFYADSRSAGAVRIMWGGGRSYPNNANDI